MNVIFCLCIFRIECQSDAFIPSIVVCVCVCVTDIRDVKKRVCIRFHFFSRFFGCITRRDAIRPTGKWRMKKKALSDSPMFNWIVEIQWIWQRTSSKYARQRYFCCSPTQTQLLCVIYFFHVFLRLKSLFVSYFVFAAVDQRVREQKTWMICFCSLMNWKLLFWCCCCCLLY